MTIKKLTKDTLIYEEGQENSLDIINNNFEELDNSNAKLNKENIFGKDQTIKHDWVSLYLDSSSHSSLRYKQNWIEIFALSVWSEKDFKISRFVDWNWVWDVLVVNNSNWNIQIDWIINLLKDKYLIWRNQNNTESFAIWTNNHWGFFNVRNPQWEEFIKFEWGKIKLINLPTSPAGLTSWYVWRDGDNLKIVP